MLNKFFPIFYTILTTSLLIVSSPIIFFLSFREKYRKSIPARFFLWNNRSPQIENSFWFHGCSLGEINALKPFISEIAKTNKVLITTTTEAGFNSAKKFHTSSRFLPFEQNLFFWTKSQEKLIVLEAELWFLLFFIAKIRGTQTILLSARISQRSFPKYLKAKWFYSKIFSNIDTIFAQSEIDKERFEKLGAKNIEVLGNIKLLKSKKTENLNIPTDKMIIVGASTHPHDEQYILDSFLKFGNGRLILVPRHKERFNEVWNLIKEFGNLHNLTSSKFSENQNFQTDIILVDAFGILINIYAKSNVVILGGGFYDGIGGHNPIEPASFQNKIISGRYMFNQNELLKSVSHIQIVEKENISQALHNLKNMQISEISQDINFQKIITKLKSHIC